MPSCFRCGQEWGEADFAYCDQCGYASTVSPNFAEPIRYGPICSPKVIGSTNSADHLIAVITRSITYQDRVHLLRRTDGKEIAQESLRNTLVAAMPAWDNTHYLVTPMASWEFQVFDAQRLKYFTIASSQGEQEEFGRPQACIRDRNGKLVGLGITDRGRGERYLLHSCYLDLQSRRLTNPQAIQIPKGVPPSLLSTLSVLPSVEGSLLLRVNDRSKDYWMLFDADRSVLHSIGQTSKLAYALRCEGDLGYIALAEERRIVLHGLRSPKRIIELPENSAYATTIGVYTSGDIFVGLVDRTGDHQLLHYRGGLLERSVPHQMPAQVQRLHYVRNRNRLIVLASSAYAGSYVCSVDLDRRNVEQLFAIPPRNNSLSMIMTDWDTGEEDIVVAAGTQLVKISLVEPSSRRDNNRSRNEEQSPHPRAAGQTDTRMEPSVPFAASPFPQRETVGDPSWRQETQRRTSTDTDAIQATLHTEVMEPIRIQSARDFEMVLISETSHRRFRVTEVFAFYPALYLCEMRAGISKLYSNEQRISVPIRFLGEGDYKVRLSVHIVDENGRSSQIFVETATFVSVLDPMRQPTSHTTTYSYNTDGGDQVIINRNTGQSTGSSEHSK